MSERNSSRNRVREHRLARGFSQEELATLAGISRTGVSAIEGGRLVPSVAAALALARALDGDVESLFGRETTDDKPANWAWQPTKFPCRFWQAEVNGRRWLYPAAGSPSFSCPHDGVARSPHERPANIAIAERTLVFATCDPAAGLLAQEYNRLTGFRLLVIQRSSRQGLADMRQGIVHAAGIHLARNTSAGGNAKIIRAAGLAMPLLLAHVAIWDEGVAISPSIKTRSVRDAVSRRLHWVGREEGAGARRCQDEVLSARPAPRRIATSHWGVVEAVKSGWAEAGICQRLAAEEGGVQFLPVCREAYDLCFPAETADEPRLAALIRVLRSLEYRTLLSELPGCGPQAFGELEVVG